MKKLIRQSEIEAEIKKLQGHAKLIARKRGTIIRGILAQMNEHEISLSEIRSLFKNRQNKTGRDPRKSTKKRAAVPVKYKGPNGETWTGRGRMPRWLVTAEAAGKKREHFAV
jgi:DNA-binding protein H-NS